MNIELAEKVLEHIKIYPEAFDINSTIDKYCSDFKVPKYPCGTVACIAGWTVLLSEQKEVSADDIENDFSWRSWNRVRREARELLEISNTEADRLFTPQDDDGDELEDDEAIARFEQFIKDKIKEGFKG